jgi:hypothetical protein
VGRCAQWIQKRLHDMIAFKENPIWHKDNKFAITPESLITLAAPLGKCATLRETATQRKSSQTEERRTAETTKKKTRGKGAQVVSMSGLVKTALLTGSQAVNLNPDTIESQASSLAVDPQRIAPRKSRKVHSPAPKRNGSLCHGYARICRKDQSLNDE